MNKRKERKLNGLWVPVSAVAHAIGLVVLTFILNNQLIINFDTQTFKSILTLIEIGVSISLILHVLSLFSVPYYYWRKKRLQHKASKRLIEETTEKMIEHVSKAIEDGSFNNIDAEELKRILDKTGE